MQVKDIKKNYEEACNAYLKLLLQMWELDEDYGYWVGNDVGGVYAYGDLGLFVNFDDMRYVVENNIKIKEYREWLDYTVWATEVLQPCPNLKSWHKGCPRADKATQERLTMLKREIEQTVEHVITINEQTKEK